MSLLDSIKNLFTRTGKAASSSAATVAHEVRDAAKEVPAEALALVEKVATRVAKTAATAKKPVAKKPVAKTTAAKKPVAKTTAVKTKTTAAQEAGSQEAGS